MKPYHTTAHHNTSDCNMPYQLMVFHTMQHDMYIDAIPSCHMSCHVMSCHVMSCHVMSCHVTAFDALIRQQGPCAMKGAKAYLSMASCRVMAHSTAAQGLSKAIMNNPSCSKAHNMTCHGAAHNPSHVIYHGAVHNPQNVIYHGAAHSAQNMFYHGAAHNPQKACKPYLA